MKILILSSVLLVLTGCNALINNITAQTVMITNMTSNSGGSGSIIETSKDGSKILTNGHVCEVVKKGGLIHTSDLKTHIVVSYVKSNLHDLCVIEVAEDLKYPAKLSNKPPYMYEDAIISGHPHLHPTTITKGFFSDKRIIQVVMGLRDCTQTDLDNEGTQMFCLLIGKLPIIKQFESIFVAALIQPGSSGSAIYNSNGEIDAVVFAGSGDLGFAYAVPFEYINKFLTSELTTFNKQYPSNLIDLGETSSNSDVEKKYEHVCNSLGNKTTTQKFICSQVDIYYKKDN